MIGRGEGGGGERVVSFFKFPHFIKKIILGLIKVRFGLYGVTEFVTQSLVICASWYKFAI